MKVPFLSFERRNTEIKSEILSIFEEFFDTQYYVLGKFTKIFEEEYAKFSNTKHCVGVSNGLDALHLALKALNIGVGDEVVVPSNTYIATVNAIVFTGATPVFVEPDINTFNIDPNLIEKAITKKTKAIIPVHLYGQPCEMDKIMSIADAYKLFVIEDNAQSHGATYKGRTTGSFGHINATSFYPSKNLGALGEAGAITTDYEKFAEKIKMLRNYGSSQRYYNDEIGYNNRIDEAQAAFLSVNLKYLNKWTEERRRIASKYNELLNPMPGVVAPKVADGVEHVYHLYVIRTKYRDRLQKHLTDSGIGTLIHYPVPPHLQKAYAYLGYKKGDFPIAEEIAETCLSLPLWIGLDGESINQVKNSIEANF